MHKMEVILKTRIRRLEVMMKYLRIKYCGGNTGRKYLGMKYLGMQLISGLKCINRALSLTRIRRLGVSNVEMK
jgi:hypothetical protein